MLNLHERKNEEETENQEWEIGTQALTELMGSGNLVIRGLGFQSPKGGGDKKGEGVFCFPTLITTKDQ